MPAPCIALDAFGGDSCPQVELHAAVAAARAGIEILLVGEAARLETQLAAVPDLDPEARARIRVRHASGRIEMSDRATEAVRAKSDASMPVAFDAVVAGDASAVVSAGHSGAMLACGLVKFGRIAAVDRPAIATVLPRLKGRGLMLDVGANVDCRPEHLVQFAAMGSAFARIELGIELPTLGLLSNGTELSKGTALTRATDEALRAMPSHDFEYVGYVEGTGLLSSEVDVIVTDGFSGNVALKVLEGSVAALGEAVGPDLLPEALRRHFDVERYGGAPLLGVNGVAVIAHGSSSPRALFHAIKLAKHFVERDLTGALRETVARHGPADQAARSGVFPR